jgi:G patch domain-containing protein 1
VSAGLPQTTIEHTNVAFDEADDGDIVDDNSIRVRSPPPKYPYAGSEASASTSLSRPAPPPFSSLYTYASAEDLADDHFKLPSSVTNAFSEARASSVTAAPAYAPVASSSSDNHPFEPSTSFQDAITETKRALPQDTKGESSGHKLDESSEPPPAYSEGYSPLLSFTYLMAAAGGAASIITQVQQGGPPVNTIGGEPTNGAFPGLHAD